MKNLLFLIAFNPPLLSLACMLYYIQSPPGDVCFFNYNKKIGDAPE